MTIQEYLLRRITSNGLSDSQAGEVVAAMKDAPEHADLKDRWNDDTSGYSAKLLDTLWFSAKGAAVKWIDANKPKHWARAVFAS